MFTPLLWPAPSVAGDRSFLMPLSRCGSANDEPLQGIGVLVVEDNDQVANALACVLTDAGMAVMGPAATSREAQQLMVAQSPDLALVDFNLGGEQTAVCLIEGLLQRKQRVIVMSGLAIPPASISKDAVFLQKPFSADELFAAMRQVMLAAA